MKDKEFMVEKIRSQYTETKHTDLDALKALDKKVKKPANVFAFTYGSIGAVIMGAGMSLVMTDIGTMLGMTETMIPGIIVGIAGMVMALTTYPIYKKILSSRKKKFAPQIMELSDRVMKG
ncbi:MAG: dihydropteridine reductase [Oscillospiraceae bacterium]|nr:dihydropteridine reductase [Oscillospiraceae bacterium]